MRSAIDVMGQGIAYSEQATANSEERVQKSSELRALELRGRDC
jgi:hypothetical protein